MMVKQSMHSCFAVQVILSISLGNSAPENGFSINKAMLDVHENSLGESIIEALREKMQFYSTHQYLIFLSLDL